MRTLGLRAQRRCGARVRVALRLSDGALRAPPRCRAAACLLEPVRPPRPAARRRAVPTPPSLYPYLPPLQVPPPRGEPQHGRLHCPGLRRTFAGEGVHIYACTCHHPCPHAHRPTLTSTPAFTHTHICTHLHLQKPRSTPLHLLTSASFASPSGRRCCTSSIAQRSCRGVTSTRYAPFSTAAAPQARLATSQP